MLRPVATVDEHEPNRAVLLAALTAALVGGGIAAYGLFLPHSLLGVHDYDDGVYFGASLRLVAGVLPYRDYVLTHPPGIALLLSPIALLSRAIGSDGGLAIARILTVLVAGLNCGLVALAVRHRGPVASLAGGLALACFPIAVSADQTVLLEPYLMAGCLAGTVLAFEHGELAIGRRALWAGVAFGLAGDVRIWAVVPFIALLCCALGRCRRSGLPLLAGAAAGFVLPCLPFAAASPGAFFHDIFIDQVLRSAGSAGKGVVTRLAGVTGLTGFSAQPGTHAVVAITLAAVILVACSYYLMWGRARRCDWFFLLASVLSVAAVLSTPQFYEYYSYFPGVFIAGVIGLCAGRWAEVLDAVIEAVLHRPPHELAVPPDASATQAASNPPSSAGQPSRALRLIPVMVVLVVAAVMVPVDISKSHTYIEATKPTQASALVERDIPAGACVVTDDAVVLISSNRFFATNPSCPQTVDSYGAWLSVDASRPPPSPGVAVPTLASEWRGWFSQAQYVVESSLRSDYIPWTPSLVAWFKAHFHLVGRTSHAYIYARGKGPTPAELLREWTRAGLRALRAKNLREAARDFATAAADDHSSPIGDFDLGTVETRLGRRTSAETAYRRALSIDRRYVPALYDLARLLAKKDPNAAINLYDRAIAAQPSNARVRFNLGLLLVRIGRHSAGLSELERAIALDPHLRASLPSKLHVPSTG
jgi:hypothetical protein